MGSSHDVDLCVLGGGSAGIRAARTAARLGARVALVEDRELGGTCVNAGCIPKKLLMYASRFGPAFADARAHGWSVGTPRFDWAELLRAKDREVARLRGAYRSMLEDAGVVLVQARGSLRDANVVEVGDRALSAAYVLVATGGRPGRPEVPGAEHGITSDEAFQLPRLPGRVLIAGGGYVALEFASIFRGLGADVRVVHRGERILRGFDTDVRVALEEELAKRGIRVDAGTEVRAISRARDRWRVDLSRGSDEYDEVMWATGRRPTTAGLGLERAGVALRADGAVEVDEVGRTSVASVYAVGDVTGRIRLTPVAIAEGQAVAETLFGGGGPVAPDRAWVPTCVFTQPAVGVVGWSEEAARERCGSVRVYRSRFRPLEHALGTGDERNLVKLVVDAATDRVLGCHVVATEAAEIVQGFAVALRCGVTKAQLDAGVGIHPSVAEELFTLRDVTA